MASAEFARIISTSPPAASVGLVWCAIFALNGAIIAGLLLHVVRRVVYGRLNWIDALGWCIIVAHLGWLPGRMFGSLVMYHAIFREGWWVVLWAIVYSYALAGVLKYFARQWAERLVALGVESPQPPLGLKERGLL